VTFATLWSTALTASALQRGQSDCVRRGTPNGGVDRSRLFGSGAGAHTGVGLFRSGSARDAARERYQPALAAAERKAEPKTCGRIAHTPFLALDCLDFGYGPTIGTHFVRDKSENRSRYARAAPTGEAEADVKRILRFERAGRKAALWRLQDGDKRSYTVSTVATKTRIVKIGNSRGIRIPKTLLDEADLPEEVELHAQPGRLVVQAARRPRTGWAAAAKRMRARAEDRLLDETTSNQFDREEWEWR
jgi:antitoxin MazE